MARNAGKESKKDHKHREKDNKEIKASKKEFMENGSEPLMRLEEERRKADSPFGHVPLSSSSS